MLAAIRYVVPKPRWSMASPVSGPEMSRLTDHASWNSVTARVTSAGGTASETSAVRVGRSCALISPLAAKSSIITGSHAPSPVLAPGR